MNEPEIRAALATVFSDVFDNEVFDFADDLSSEGLESWDSLGHIRLIMAAEEAFGVSFTIDEIEELTSVRHFIDRITAKL
jgi:acyl carrier protein